MMKNIVSKVVSLWKKIVFEIRIMLCAYQFKKESKVLLHQIKENGNHVAVVEALWVERLLTSDTILSLSSKGYLLQVKDFVGDDDLDYLLVKDLILIVLNTVLIKLSKKYEIEELFEGDGFVGKVEG